ncbi:MAG TPA: hypothetical protein VLT59_16920 [Steroidobacteraceae bacterium]|nr:hypothetical protein [Steroidobacteraceae bacterium]
MRTSVVVAAIAILAVAAPVHGLETERVSDRDLENIVESLDKAAEKFRKSLDRDIRTAVIRSPSGEVDMKRFFEDFDENIERIDKRYKGSYSAGAEALAVLRQGNDLRAFVAAHPGMKGEAEWQLLEAELARLANAYTAKWPLDPVNPGVRRIGDNEFGAALEALDRGFRDLERAVDKQMNKWPASEQEPAQEILREAALANSLVKPLKSKLKDGDPALAEARILLDKAASLDVTLGRLPLDEQTRRSWQATRNALGKFAQGFGLVWPPTS